MPSKSSLGCLLGALLLNVGCASTSGGVALDHAVMGYDRTAVELVSKLLLLNIARAHRDRPLHFTTVPSIAATYDFQFNAGIGPAATGDIGYLPMPIISGGTSENPTITITPMQGDEFTQRLLAPFDEKKLTLLLRQDYDVDALLRLMCDGYRPSGGANVDHNRPADRDGYARFRKVVAHLSAIQDGKALHVDPLHFNVKRAIPAGSVAPEERGQLLNDPTLSYDAEKETYQIDWRVNSRVVITNYDPGLLSNEQRMALYDEAKQLLANEILIDIRPDHFGGQFPLHGALRLRSFLGMLTFLGRGISAEPEFHVAPDPRPPRIKENPVRTLSVVVHTRAPKKSDLAVELDGRTYALAPEANYQWNKKVFNMLYQLFQMTVSSTPTATPQITIAK